MAGLGRRRTVDFHARKLSWCWSRSIAPPSRGTQGNCSAAAMITADSFSLAARFEAQITASKHTY